MNNQTTLTKSSNREREALNKPSDDLPTLAPPVDIYENKDEFIVVADLPGVAPEDVSVRLTGDRLEVEGRQVMPAELGEFASPVRFARSFVVPDSIDPAGVKATSELGILTIHLKKAEARKPRQITVTAS
jgi:HSP20 family molecular chaperone IbpA